MRIYVERTDRKYSPAYVLAKEDENGNLLVSNRAYKSALERASDPYEPLAFQKFIWFDKNDKQYYSHWYNESFRRFESKEEMECRLSEFELNLLEGTY